MAVKYDFRILLKTTQGREFSYYSASFFNSEVDTNFALSSSQVFNRITGSTSCSYHNDFKFPSTGTYRTDRFFVDNIFLSASLVGGPDTGSIKFIYKGNRKQAPMNGVGPKVKDRLERFKFFGTKVCNVLNLHENFWYRPEDFKITQKGNNFYRGTVEATELVVTNNFEVSNLGAISSDLPFNIIPSGSAGETSRYIKFTNVSGSDTGTTPNLDLKLGYDNELNSYVLSASNNVNFKIDGVTSLNVTNFTSSYITSSVQQLFTEITSSGNSLFGDVRTDHHKFDGNVAIRGRAGSQLSHSVDGLSVDGDISAEDVTVGGNLVVNGNGGSYFNNSPILAVKGIHIHSSSQNGNQQIVFSNDTSEGDKVPVIFRTAKANGGLLKLNVYRGLGYGIHHFVLSGSGGHSTQDIHVGIGGLPTPKMLSVFGSTTFGEDSSGSDEDIHIFSGSIDNVGSYIKTSGHITASGNISSSGTITAEQLTTTDDLNVGDNILFESEQAGLGRGADEWGQMYFSDELIQMGATGLGAGAFRVDGHSSAGALFITSSGKVGIGGGFDVNSPPGEALEVVGNISASATSTGSFGIVQSTGLTANESVIVGADGKSLTSSDLIAYDTVNNRVGIGITSPEVKLHIDGDAAQEAQIRLEQHNNTADAPDIRIRRSRGTHASPSVLAANDYQFRLNVDIYDGSSYTNAGQLRWDNDGTTDNNSTNNVFGLQTRVAGTTADRLTINKDGGAAFSGPLTASGNISSSGTGIFNKLEIHGADGTLAADYIIHKDDSNTKFGFPENDKFKIKTAGTDRYVVDTTHTFTGNTFTDGNISASGDLIIGNLDSNTYVSASNGNIEMSGSGAGRLEVTGSIFVSNTGSFSYITASHIDTDSDSLSIGGESINKTLVQNVKRQFSPSTLAPSGRAQSVGHMYVAGDISGSGTIYGKQRQITHHNYYDATASEENFIPVNYIVESTSLTYTNQIVAPYDGRIIKVIVHTDHRFVDAVLKIYTDGSVSGTSPSAAIPQNGSTTFSNFTESSGNANFSAGDLVAISITPDSDPGNLFVTVVWEYDIFT